MQTPPASQRVWPFFGNERAIHFLQASVAAQTVAHAYIFEGLADVGKASVARYFAATLMCKGRGEASAPCQACVHCQYALKGRHSDIHVFQREEGKKYVTVAAVRELIRRLQMGALMGSYTIGIVKDAEHLNDEAANALLKTLEEPQPHVVLILLTSDAQLLPATIRSRSQVVSFKPASIDAIHAHLLQEVGASRTQARTVARLCAGRPALALKLYQDRSVLEHWYADARAAIVFLRGTVDEKMRACHSVLAGITQPAQQRQRVEHILVRWQSVVRDALLAACGLDDLVQHEDLIDELRTIHLDPRTLVDLMEGMNRSKMYVAASVQPQLALEQLCII